MQRSTRTRKIVAGLATLVAATSLAQAAQAGPAATEVPDKIQVEEGHKPFLLRHATGVQIYSCNGSSWSFVAPRANLYDDKGKLRGTHFGGPTWVDQDGSKVVASRVDGVTVDPTAIPWLLLKAAPDTADGEGRLANTTFIQRTATAGGLQPAASECNAETAGTQREVPYTADYYFWKATGK